MIFAQGRVIYAVTCDMLLMQRDIFCSCKMFRVCDAIICFANSKKQQSRSERIYAFSNNKLTEPITLNRIKALPLVQAFLRRVRLRPRPVDETGSNKHWHNKEYCEANSERDDYIVTGRWHATACLSRDERFFIALR